MRDDPQKSPNSVGAEVGPDADASKLRYQTTGGRGPTQPADPVAAFLEAMAEAGIPPHNPAEVIADGRLHRFTVEGDRAGSRNGWMVLFLDGVPAGRFGSWKAGIDHTWSAIQRNALAPADLAENLRRMEAARRQREEEQERTRAAAAERARRIWREVGPADPGHPYLTAKRVHPHHAHQQGDRLVLPVADFDGLIQSLQFIDPNGAKKLLSGGRKAGCFIPVERGEEGGRVLICEGWATGATVAEADPAARVLAAVDAYNLEAVALAARRKWPEAVIVVCGDSDEEGASKARAAAKAADARVALPVFPDGDGEIDFNDPAALTAEGCA